MARPRVHDDALRERLLDEAGRVIATDGYPGLNLRTLAESVGTSTTAIYSLFGGKEGLLCAIYARAFQGFGDAQRAVGMSADPLVDLEALGLAYRSWALSHPNLFQIMFYGPATVSNADWTGAARSTIEPLLTTVARSIDAGLVRGDAWTVATALWTQVHGFVTLELHGVLPIRDPSTAIRAAVHAAVRGWRTPESLASDPQPAPH